MISPPPPFSSSLNCFYADRQCSKLKPMNKKNRQGLTPLFALGFAACGGGGSSSSRTQEPPRSNGNGDRPINPPPPFMLPDDVPLQAYENHPTNKAVYDATPQGQSSAQIDLPQGMADNIFYAASPLPCHRKGRW